MLKKMIYSRLGVTRECGPVPRVQTGDHVGAWIQGVLSQEEAGPSVVCPPTRWKNVDPKGLLFLIFHSDECSICILMSIPF